MTNLGNDWDELLRAETEQPYMQELRRFLAQEYSRGPVSYTHLDVYKRQM